MKIDGTGDFVRRVPVAFVGQGARDRYLELELFHAKERRTKPSDCAGNLSINLRIPLVHIYNARK